MKKLVTLFATILIGVSAASASTLFDPSFTSGAAPAGYTATGSGDFTYVNGSATFGDISDSSEAAYLTSTVTDPNTNTVESKFTFTPTFTATTARGQANINLFSLATNYGNNTLLTVYLQPFNFGTPEDNINISEGIGYGGSSSGTNSYSSPGIESLSGVALTLDLTTTFADGGGNATDTTTGTLSDSSGVLATFDVVSTGSDGGGGFNPGQDPLTVDFGYVNNLPSPLQQDSGNGDGILSSGTVTFSSVDVTTAPEPTTFALLLGGLGALFLIARRRATA